MRVSISGTQSVGKTTLIKYLEEKSSISDWTYVYEATRWVKDLGLVINENASVSTQQLIMGRHLFEIFNKSVDENVIYDRHPLDCAVYSTWLYKQGKMTSKELTQFTNVVKYVFEQDFFDVIAFIPIEFDLVDDGVRSTSKEYREDINLFFVMLLSELTEQSVKIKEKIIFLTGTVEERANKLIQFIESKKNV